MVQGVRLAFSGIGGTVKAMGEGRFETIRYTGKFFESDNFGESNCSSAEYKPYEEAVADVKDNQPWDDPSDPRPRFASDLHADVAQSLNLGDDWSELRFYTAVGSALDRYHGVDGFFEYGDGRVTLDITQNPAKASGYKADAIIGPEEVEYEKRRQEIAQEIAEELELKDGEAKHERRPGKRKRA